MEADKVSHQLPSFGILRIWICNEHRFERGLRTFPFFTFFSPITLSLGLFDWLVTYNVRCWRLVPRFLGVLHEPVSQEKSGQAVVPIVVAKIIQERGLACLTKAIIDNKAIPTGNNRRSASEHVEALKIFLIE